MKAKKVKVLLIVSGIFLLIFLALLVFNLFIQADTTTLVQGSIFEGLSDSTSGPPVSGATIILIDNKNNQYTGVTNVNGVYTVKIQTPSPCAYRVIVSKKGYNDRDAGTINLNQKRPNNPRMPIRYNFSIDREVDYMWSNYFNTSYPYGYADSKYHFSTWDLYAVRNIVSKSQILDKKAPAKASFEVPFQGYPQMMEKMMGLDKVWAIFQVVPITSEWTASKQMSVGKPAYTIKKRMTELNKEGKIKFDFSYSNLDKETRYKSWIYGFEVVTGFYVGDDNGNPVQSATGGSLNPDFRINRSEDNGYKPIVKIAYSDLEDFSSPQCLCQWGSPLAYPVGADTTTLGACLDNWLKAKAPDSPLIGQGKAFAEAGMRANINPAFLLAIAGQESGYGRVQGGNPNEENFFNVKCGEHQKTEHGCNGGYASFNNYSEAINELADLLVRVYLCRGLDTIGKIQDEYCPHGDHPYCEEWEGSVTQIFNQITRACLR